MARALTEDNYFDEEEEKPYQPHELHLKTSRLVNGVSLKDLNSGKGAVLKLDEEYNDDFFEMEDTFQREQKEVSYVPSFKLREDRVAPRPEQSFKSLESEMEPVDSDRFVMKKIITPGVAPKIPEHAKAVIDYEFYKEHDPIPFDSTFLQGRRKRFILDSGEVILGLDIAVKSMKKRETSKFLIKWQAAFGERGIPPRVDPKMDVFAVITLIDFSEILGNVDPNALTEDEVNKANFEDVIKLVKGYHNEGKKLFYAKNYSKAINYYHKAVTELNRLHLANSEEEKIMLELKDKTQLNLAVCYNNVKRPESACLACQELLSRQSNHGKAFYQLGKAKFLLGNYNDCRKYLLKALKMFPKNEEISDLLRRCNEKEDIDRAGRKDLYAKMLSLDSKRNDGNQRKPKQADDSILVGFEKTLREVLKSHFEDFVDDFVHTSKMTPEEVEVSLKVAEDLNLTYEEGEDGIHFKRKSIK